MPVAGRRITWHLLTFFCLGNELVVDMAKPNHRALTGTRLRPTSPAWRSRRVSSAPSTRGCLVDLDSALTSARPAAGREQTVSGVLSRTSVYYNTPSHRCRIGTSLPVRYDPFNLANAWG